MTRPLSSAFTRALASDVPTRTLAEARARAATFQAQVSTGRRVFRASDDPTAFAGARRLDAAEGRLDSYGEAVGAARFWASRTADELDGMAELMATANDLGVQGGNDTLDATGRESVAARIDDLAEALIGRLNSKAEGEYLFGGHRTNQAPFDATGAPTTPSLAGDRRYRIGPDLDLAVNVDGDRVQTLSGGTSAVDALRALAAAVRTGGAAATAALAPIAEGRDHFLALGAEAGSRLNRLDDADAQLEASALDLSRRRSDFQDADYYEAATSLAQANLQLDATLQMLASDQQRTLLDYLR
ncbi:MAG TPA: flagellin [Rhodothermales bacterium]|nr:flagellin [Rhodothermales bacterium]